MVTKIGFVQAGLARGAALWWVLSNLGQRFTIAGHGRLLSAWTDLPRD